MLPSPTAEPTAAMIKNADWQFPTGSCEAALAGAVGPDLVGHFDAEQVATQLLGDSIYTNGHLLCVHGVTGGRKQIALPQQPF